MNHLLDQLARLEHADPTYGPAVANVRADIKDSATSPHGNLGPALVASLDARCAAGAAAVTAVVEHQATARPALHRAAVPPARVRRVVPRSDFVIYHVLAGGAADLAERDVWIKRLTPGEHTLTGADLAGRTGASDRPCWWSFGEPGRPEPMDAVQYATELAVGARTLGKVLTEGVAVAVQLPAATLRAFFKPTSLEGFGPETPFRPELTGAPYGRTAPADPALKGWPEVVSASRAYADILEDDDEIDVRVLPTEGA